MEDRFVDQYSTNTDAGIGTVYSCRYGKQKNLIQSNVFLSYSTCINNGIIELYGIFSGYNGGSFTAKFVMNRMVYEIFQENPLLTTMPPAEVVRKLGKNFENVTERYLAMHTDILNERLLKIEDSSEPASISVSEINQKIRQGATIIILVKIGKDIYVLNCGCSLALAITSDGAVQLNDSLHNKENEFEKNRIEALGINLEDVLNPTRAVGDFLRTHLYEEVKEFKDALGPPVISTPDVYHYQIDPSWEHIVLLSDGVMQNLKEIEVDDIPTEVFVRLSEDHTVTSTAQALADSFARKHFDAFITMQNDNNLCTSNHREEMTVIYVKLSNEGNGLYEIFDSAISTMDTSNIAITSTSVTSYVDALNFSAGSNYKNMQKIINKHKDRKRK